MAHWILVVMLAGLVASKGATPGDASVRVLVYQKNGKGYVHDNLAASAHALREIAAGEKLSVDVTTNAAVFTTENLKRYSAVVFANSNNEAFENHAQRAAFQDYIQSGGGFMGIHSSSASERNWPWFQQMLGGKFLRHAPMQTFTLVNLDRSHPSTTHFPANWSWTDECYFFTGMNPEIQVLLTVEVATLRDRQLDASPAEKVAGAYPLAWCHETEGSRRYYTSLGHKIGHYSDPLFRNHLRGALRWVLRLE